MGKFKDLTGNVFGLLTVVTISDVKTKGNKYQWVCLCACGKSKTVTGSSLSTGQTRSCGCLQAANAKKQLQRVTRTTHGMTDTSEYIAWRNMKARCYDINHSAYINYGSRGITVCPEWLNSFEKFFEDMGCKPENHSINRLDVNKPYNKDNCTWSDNYRQASDKRKTTGVSTCIFKGVCFNHKEGKYKGYFCHKGINEHLGYSDDPLELAKLYDKRKIETFGEGACTNKSLGLY